MSYLKQLATSFTAVMLVATAASAQTIQLKVYGPGGPAPAMKEAAKEFSAANGVDVQVVAGPTWQWAADAKQNADVIFSGAENMMSDFAKALPGAFDLCEAEPLYLRPVAILVRPGNPKNIRGFKDLLRANVKVLAVAGAGQTGLWEDVAGRTGDIEMVKALRRNMVLPEAGNSAVAREMWTWQKDIDAWLIWNIWQVSNPTLADQVAVEEPYQIYRDVGVVLTTRGKQVTQALAFATFLKSADGHRIFSKWGWMTGAQH